LTLATGKSSRFRDGSPDGTSACCSSFPGAEYTQRRADGFKVLAQHYALFFYSKIRCVMHLVPEGNRTFGTDTVDQVRPPNAFARMSASKRLRQAEGFGHSDPRSADAVLGSEVCISAAVHASISETRSRHAGAGNQAGSVAKCLNVGCYHQPFRGRPGRGVQRSGSP
jgi:hypothetical protein